MTIGHTFARSRHRESVTILAQVSFKFGDLRVSVKASKMAFDSPAAFSERVAELELTSHAARFAAAGWTSLAKLAFASPQGGNEEAFVKNILIPRLG